MSRLNAAWGNFSARGQAWDHFWQDGGPDRPADVVTQTGQAAPDAPRPRQRGYFTTALVTSLATIVAATAVVATRTPILSKRFDVPLRVEQAQQNLAIASLSSPASIPLSNDVYRPAERPVLIRDANPQNLAALTLAPVDNIPVADWVHTTPFVKEVIRWEPGRNLAATIVTPDSIPFADERDARPPTKFAARWEPAQNLLTSTLLAPAQDVGLGAAVFPKRYLHALIRIDVPQNIAAQTATADSIPIAGSVDARPYLREFIRWEPGQNLVALTQAPVSTAPFVAPDAPRYKVDPRPEPLQPNLLTTVLAPAPDSIPIAAIEKDMRVPFTPRMEALQPNLLTSTLFTAPADVTPRAGVFSSHWWMRARPDTSPQNNPNLLSTPAAESPIVKTDWPGPAKRPVRITEPPQNNLTLEYTFYAPADESHTRPIKRPVLRTHEAPNLLVSTLSVAPDSIPIFAPPQERRVVKLAIRDLATSNLLTSTLAPAPATLPPSFPLDSPRVRRAYLADTVPQNLAIASLSVAVAPIISPWQDVRAPRPEMVRDVLQNLLGTTLAAPAQTPFNATNWNGPIRRVFRTWEAPQNLLALTFVAPVGPPLVFDWPSPRPQIRAIRYIPQIPLTLLVDGTIVYTNLPGGTRCDPMRSDGGARPDNVGGERMASADTSRPVVISEDRPGAINTSRPANTGGRRR